MSWQDDFWKEDSSMREKNRKRTNYRRSEMLTAGGLGLKVIPPPPNWRRMAISTTIQHSALDGVGPSVPRHRALAEIRLVCHVTSQSGVVSKHRILHHRLPAMHCLEEVPQMRFDVVPGDASVRNSLESCFLSRNCIVLLMPLLEILFAHGLRKTVSVVTWRCIHSRLRNVRQRELGQLQNSLRPLEPINLRSLRTQIETHIHRHFAILKESCVNVRHIAAIFPAQNSAHGHDTFRGLINADNILHAAYQVDQKIARHPGAILLPTTPAGKNLGIEWPFRHHSLPGIPIESLWRKIGRRRIL